MKWYLMFMLFYSNGNIEGYVYDKSLPAFDTPAECQTVRQTLVKKNASAWAAQTGDHRDMILCVGNEVAGDFVLSGGRK